MKTKMEKLDQNLQAVPLEAGLRFQDVRSTPARIYGLIEGEYARLPAAQRSLASEKLLMLQGCTSGGRVRFLTDSRRLGLRMLVTDSEGYPHMAYSGYAGIDCYLGEGTDPEYLGTRWESGSWRVNLNCPAPCRW